MGVDLVALSFVQSADDVRAARAAAAAAGRAGSADHREDRKAAAPSSQIDEILDVSPTA